MNEEWPGGKDATTDGSGVVRSGALRRQPWSWWVPPPRAGGAKLQLRENHPPLCSGQCPDGSPGCSLILSDAKPISHLMFFQHARIYDLVRSGTAIESGG